VKQGAQDVEIEGAAHVKVWVLGLDPLDLNPLPRGSEAKQLIVEIPRTSRSLAELYGPREQCSHAKGFQSCFKISGDNL
jgi:hypothetical protein